MGDEPFRNVANFRTAELSPPDLPLELAADRRVAKARDEMLEELQALLLEQGWWEKKVWALANALDAIVDTYRTPEEVRAVAKRLIAEAREALNPPRRRTVPGERFKRSFSGKRKPDPPPPPENERIKKGG